MVIGPYEEDPQAPQTGATTGDEAQPAPKSYTLLEYAKKIGHPLAELMDLPPEKDFRGALADALGVPITPPEEFFRGDDEREEDEREVVIEESGPLPPLPSLHKEHEGRIELDTNTGGPGVHLERFVDGTWAWVARDPVLNSVVACGVSRKTDVAAAKSYARFVDAVLSGHYKLLEGYYKEIVTKYYTGDKDEV